MSAEERVIELEARVAQLEETIVQKDKRIAEISREIPLGCKKNKTRRLDIPVKMLQQPDNAEGQELKWPAHKVRYVFVAAVVIVIIVVFSFLVSFKRWPMNGLAAFVDFVSN